MSLVVFLVLVAILFGLKRFIGFTLRLLLLLLAIVAVLIYAGGSLSPFYREALFSDPVVWIIGGLFALACLGSYFRR